MKKFCGVLIFLFSFFFIPQVGAYNSGIENFYMDMTVQENGDLHIREVFVLNGSYNGFERIIYYRNSLAQPFNPSSTMYGGSNLHNGSDLQLIAIKGIPVSEVNSLNSLDYDGDLFTEVASASTGDYGKYAILSSYSGKTFRIYNPSGKRKAFYVEYTVKNAAILHNDVGEVGWNIFGTELVESIAHFEMMIHIPGNQTELRGWAHGPLYGNIELVSKEKIKVTIDGLDAKTAMDARFVFDPSVIAKTTKKTSVNALDKIVAYETMLADAANQEREEAMKALEKQAEEAVLFAKENPNRENYEYASSLVSELRDGELRTRLLEELTELEQVVIKKERTLNIMLNGLYLGWLIGLGYLIYYVYRKHDKEYQATFTGKYYRDFPAEYGPETVSYLIRQTIENRDLSAAILNLICKKSITCEQIDKKDYRLTYSGMQEETGADRELLQFLFDNYKVREVTLSELKTRAKKRYSSFIERYTDWKNVALAEAKAQDFFESKGTVKGLSILYIILGMIVVALTMGVVPFKGIAIFAIVVGVIAAIYIFSFIRRTKKGNEDFRRWMGLKNFMEDFGRMDTKDLPELILWEKYLVYAVSLGCADKLAKTMQIKVEEMQMNGYDITDMMIDYHYLRMMVMFNRTIDTMMNTAITSAYSTRAANTSSSSGGGFGGGFSGGSGGGGSFGGGGGGGRF